MKDSFQIVNIAEQEKKARYTRGILEALPEWFGNAQAVDGYVKEAQDLPYWAAMDAGENCVGFFAVKTHYQHTGDIFVCGVLPAYQRKGVGRVLYQAVEQHLKANGCKYVMVKTLSEVADFEPYERTRSFYKSVGFEPLITLTEMWDEENPCLIMVKVLA